MTDFLSDPNTLIALPGGGQVSAGFLAQQGVYQTDSTSGQIIVPGDAYAVGFGGTTYQVGANTQWFSPYTAQDPAAKKATDDHAAAANQTAASADAILHNYGLDSLVPIVDGWIRQGMSWEEVQLQLYDTSTAAGKIFDQRFPAIKLRRDAGLNPISPDEYVSYERGAQQLMRAAGLPPGFYDQKSDFTDLLTKDVSLNELTTRINDGYVAVTQAPSQVRQAFQNFFGTSGDSALAAYFLDPTKAVPVLEKAVNEAKIGGAGLQFGFNLGLDRSAQIADTGATFDSARNTFSNIADLNPLFNETISETKDLTAENEGVNAGFNLDQGQAKTAIQQRLDQRKADFSGGGGAALTNQGLIGLGTAR